MRTSYISYRQSYAHHPAKKQRFGGPPSNGFADHNSEERRGLISSGAYEDDGDAIIEMDLLPPRWIDIQDEVTEILTNVTLKAANLDKLHQKHVLPGFNDEHIKQQEERDIERLTQEITRGFHECQKAIKRIETMVKEARMAGSLSKGDETMAKNIQVALAARVQEVSASFRKKQSKYLNSIPALRFSTGTTANNAQKCVPLVDSNHPFHGPQLQFRILTQIPPSSNRMPTNPFPNQHSSRLRKSASKAMMQPLRSGSRKSMTSQKASLNWRISSEICRLW